MSLDKGKIVSIFGVKGGIGKSILTMNLAGVASNKKLKTLIIDMDIYGGCIGFSLGKSFEKTLYNFVDDYNNNRFKDIKDYINSYNEFIDYVVCPKDPRQSNKVHSNYLEILIDKAKFNYDLVLIDNTHVLNETTLSILDKSDEILLVISNNIFDLKNMKNLISIFKDLDKNNYKVILNNSISNDIGYFNIYDIKDVIKSNIDYVISEKYYVKNIDQYILEYKIITLLKKYINTKDYMILDNIIVDCIGDSNE